MLESRGTWLSMVQAGLDADKPATYEGASEISFYYATDTGVLYTTTSPATVGGATTWVPFSSATAAPINVPDATTYSVTAAQSGRTLVFPDLTADIAVTLPVAAAGLRYEFIYGGLAADAQDWNISTRSNTNFYLGGLIRITVTGPVAAVAAPDGNSNSIMNILTPNVGTRVLAVCNGTNWFVTGTVVTANAPTFADQP